MKFTFAQVLKLIKIEGRVIILSIAESWKRSMILTMSNGNKDVGLPTLLLCFPVIFSLFLSQR